VSQRIPKGTGTSPRFVAHVVSINSKKSLCERSPLQLQYYWNARTSNKLLLWKVTPFSGPSDPSHFVTSTLSGLSICCYSLFRPKLQQKATTMRWNTYIPQCQWDDMMTNDHNIFVKPLPPSFPLKF